MDLLFRKVARDGGETLKALMADIQKTIDEKRGCNALSKEGRPAARQRDIEALFAALMGKMGESLYHVVSWQSGVVCLVRVGHRLVAYTHAALAFRKIAKGHEKDRGFYQGKDRLAQLVLQPSIGPVST